MRATHPTRNSLNHCWHFFCIRVGEPDIQEVNCCNCGRYEHQRRTQAQGHGPFAPKDDWSPLPIDGCSPEPQPEKPT